MAAPPRGLERRRRGYFRQQWDALADEARADALSDRQAVRGFARLELAAAGVPAATTLLKFRRRRETHDRCPELFTANNAALSARGWWLRAGTLVDATRIAAPASTKNLAPPRDPERHPTKQGNPWDCGLKAHLGAERDSTLAPAVVVPAATVAAGTQTAERRHGPEPPGPADAGATGVEQRAEIGALERKLAWPMARKRGASKALVEGVEPAARPAVEKAKASVRAGGEPPCHSGKNLLRQRQVRERGRAKNGQQRYTLLGRANVVIGARRAPA